MNWVQIVIQAVITGIVVAVINEVLRRRANQKNKDGGDDE